MKIFNVMMCRDLGGLQQVFLDYSSSLTAQGNEVINITSSNAMINGSIHKAIKLPNLFSWCFISKLYFSLLVFMHKPDIIICHGGRAINFATAFRTGAPVVGVTHGYSFKRLRKCDYVIAITKHLKQYMVDNGYKEERIFLLPNMVEVGTPYKKPKKFIKSIIIGSLGRLVRGKGFNHLIDAIRILTDKKYDVRLLIGGSGEEEGHLRNQTEALGITDKVSFTGWVHDKKGFFNKLDIFCCPSEDEAFGMVILEAMKYSRPIVATKSQGALEILHHKQDGLLAENKSPEDIAKQIAYLIDHEALAADLTKNAYAKLLKQYDISGLGPSLSGVMHKILESIR